MDVPPPPAPGASVAFSGPTPPQISPASATPVAPPSESVAVAAQPGESSGLAPAVAKLFGNGGIPRPSSLDVSYRVLKNPNEIVTVFTDPRTGVEIAQFPSEIVIGLAEFFDQQQGATLDRNA